MKIIKEGNKQEAEKKMKRILTFECCICGCIFEAEKGEYIEGNQYEGDSATCPCCMQTVYLFQEG